MSEKAFIFGPNGKLGAIWVKALNALNFSTYGFGLEETYTDSQNQLNSYSQMDLVKVSASDISNLINKYLPRVLILNSGFDSPPGTGKSNFHEFSLDSWLDFINVNLVGNVKILNAALQSEKVPERIVVIGSMYATSVPILELYSHYGPSGQIKHPGYAASKAALLATIRQYSVPFLKRGSFLNMLSPGAIQGNQDLEFVNKISRYIPMGRLGNLAELESGLKFLIDSGNTYYVGQNLVIDGGMGIW